jgi:hypothetical protein
MTSVIDLRTTRGPVVGDLADLQGYLLQLEGQPFLFAQVTYGDELTLHFGTPQEFHSPKIRRRIRGAYVLTARASAWRLHSMPQGCLVYAGSLPHSPALAGRKTIGTQELEQLTLIEPGSRVVAADILGFRLPWGIELGLSFSDGSTFFLTPLPAGTETNGAEGLPPIADWELFTPHGRVLLVGPGFKWEYADAGTEDAVTPPGP